MNGQTLVKFVKHPQTQRLQPLCKALVLVQEETPTEDMGERADPPHVPTSVKIVFTSFLDQQQEAGVIYVSVVRRRWY